MDMLRVADPRSRSAPERASVRRSSLGSWFGRKLFLAIAIEFYSPTSLKTLPDLPASALLPFVIT